MLIAMIFETPTRGGARGNGAEGYSLARWPEDLRDLWERAAIIEYDGGEPVAERRADT
jgi:hypothetical protein